MPQNDLWGPLCETFPLTPAEWEIVDGDNSDGPYCHGTSVLGLSFSPDDSKLALAGGGRLPWADTTVRIIRLANQKNVQTLYGHACGIHDVCFDPHSGILASASHDYSVLLWDVENEDVIFFRGEDQKTKGYCRFTREGSLLAIGEYAEYESPRSFYVYDLKRQTKVFELALPDEHGVTALAISNDSKFLAVAAESESRSGAARLYLVQLETLEIVNEHLLEDTHCCDIAFLSGHDRLIAGVIGGPFDNFESGLIEIDAQSGEIHWQEHLGGVGIHLACHPHSSEVAVGFNGPTLRIYDSRDWSVIREHDFQGDDDIGGLCSLAYSNSGSLLAYGCSTGKFGILETERE
ncbi:MAG: hypothetical protein CMJ47_09145 [Planctomyces sp.]|nr:hypothetical protein [Planctomyces sp.]